MVCLGFEPRAAGWKAQTDPLSYGGTPKAKICLYQLHGREFFIPILLFNYGYLRSFTRQ